MRHRNNEEYRKNVIKDLLAQLHAGKSVDEVKDTFQEAFGSVSATEISKAEEALVAEGMDVSEIQKLCDVHAAVFEGNIEEIHSPEKYDEIEGHPAHTLKAENRAIEAHIENNIRPKMQALKDGSKADEELKHSLEKLLEIDRHYMRKENLFFPYMEKHGITAPPKVMWGVDDEIRANLKEAIKLMNDGHKNAKDKLQDVLHSIGEMIFKEDNILLPMVFEVFTEEEWKSIEGESDELGYCLIDPPARWSHVDTEKGQTSLKLDEGIIVLPTGKLLVSELDAVLNSLPFDMTFVGKDGTVKYFSHGPERIFPRTKSVIGREVSNCHPPASVHIVEEIIEDLKSGKKTSEEFWLRIAEKYVYIRYFAVRDEDGEYLGVLEVTQNIAPIQEIVGEKRLLSDNNE